MDVREKAKNDKRLIDANAFLKDILTAGIGKTIIEYSESDIGYMIRKRPTVDAVPVVRCAQCKHFKRNLENDTYCSSVNGLTDPQEDDFCSYGEKRGSEHE